MEKLETIISRIPGFKIAPSHFRIGSKIHISDFYYAKRFFQNGFFASRVAFILAKDIAREIRAKGKIDLVAKHGLTLVGYELYSSLLLSLVDKFLRITLSLPPEKINHNILEDSDSLNLCKASPILGQLVIVVPIASTFSTAIKIENQLVKLIAQLPREKSFSREILDTHFNVLYISDGELSDLKTPIENSFQWKSKDIAKREIKISAYYTGTEETGAERTQKFYLSVPTKWYMVEKCELCHPQKDGKEQPKEELPLYETDRTAVTPSIIFSLPSGRDIHPEDLARTYKLDPKVIKYGHHTRNNKHFLYGINTEAFLEANRTDIEAWLATIRDRDTSDFNRSHREIDRVILISTCHYSNSGFINLVNEQLFASSANIIHYDPANDYIQNFRMVYGHELNRATKIYFIDDSLKSGSAFDSIDKFLNNTLEETDQSSKFRQKGVSGCFFLLNKSQPHTMQNLRKSLVNEKIIYAFANLHLYTSLRADEQSPLEIERSRYLELAKSSLLDSLRVHFLEQAKKLTTGESSPKRDPYGLKAAKHLEMLIATHRIYEYFRTVPHPVLDSLKEFLNHLLEHTRSPIEAIKRTNPSRQRLTDLEAAYLKVLTQSPFVQYHPLRSAVFRWVLGLLTDFVGFLKTEIRATEPRFNYSMFQELKFLIRRAGLLNSNYLLSKEFFGFLENLYGDAGIPSLIAGLECLAGASPGQITLESEPPYDPADALVNLREFHVFYAAQIKELLLKNESRGIRIEENLRKLNTSNNPYVRQIVRMLRVETAVIVQKFYENICNEPEWKAVFKPKSDEEKKLIEYSNVKIKAFLDQPSIFSNHRYQSIDAFFISSSAADSRSFLNYLWLKYFLGFDELKKGKIDLDDKTNYIMSKLVEMFTDHQLPLPGAFMVVNDGQQKSFFAYNKNQSGATELDSEKWDGPQMKYLREFLNGPEKKTGSTVEDQTDPLTDQQGGQQEEQRDIVSSGDDKKSGHVESIDAIPLTYLKTIIELARNQNGDWVDIYETGENRTTSGLGSDVISRTYDRIVLVRLNKRNPDQEGKRSQGMLGFYYTEKKRPGHRTRPFTSINVIRYLLLVRDSLSEFIQDHHENDEFTTWRIAQIKQKMSILSGHGKEMLIDIALHQDEKYKEIVYTLLKVQRLLIDKKEQFSELDKLNLVDVKINEIFSSFFPSTDINLPKTYFENDLKKMAREIFRFPEIENAEILDEKNVVVNIKGYTGFKFDRRLLDMFCFELFVNAKKNRWLFLEDIDAGKGGKISANTISITIKNTATELSLRIANTGPALHTGEMDKVKEKRNIKTYDYSSGIELIDTVLREFDRGKMTITDRPITSELSWFIVELKLKST